MKQEVVIKVSMLDQESRAKALKIVVGFSGVLSAKLTGDDLRQIELTGEGLDLTGLTCLRKKVGHGELVSIELLDGDKKPKNKLSVQQLPYWCGQSHHYYIVDQGRYPDASCSIM